MKTIVFDPGGLPPTGDASQQAKVNALREDPYRLDPRSGSSHLPLQWALCSVLRKGRRGPRGDCFVAHCKAVNSSQRHVGGVQRAMEEPDALDQP